MQFRREIIDGCNVRGGTYNGPVNALGKANGTQLSIVTYSQEFDKKKNLSSRDLMIGKCHNDREQLSDLVN